MKVRVLFVAFGFCYLAGVSDVAGQVKIKEKVDLGLGSISGGVHSSRPSANDTFFIVPRPGILAVEPTLAHKLRAAFPSELWLEVRLPDTLYSVSLLPFLPCDDVNTNRYWDSCGQYAFGTTYDKRRCSSTNTFYTKRLHIGDTVQFAFQGEFLNPSVSIDWYGDHGYVEMATPRPPNCQGAHAPYEELSMQFRMIDTTITIIRPDSAVVYPTYQGTMTPPV